MFPRKFVAGGDVDGADKNINEPTDGPDDLQTNRQGFAEAESIDNRDPLLSPGATPPVLVPVSFLSVLIQLTPPSC